MSGDSTKKPKGKPTALKALKRAAKQALELARQIRTSAWIMEGDKLLDATKLARRLGKPTNISNHQNND